MHHRKFAATATIALLTSLGGCIPLTGWADPPSDTAGGSSTVAEVVRVIDGDTLAVRPTESLPATNASGTEHSVRLLGIDAPEMNKRSEAPAECGAEAATARLAELVSGSPVTLVFDSRSDHVDRYGRSLAYVEVPGEPVVDVALQLAGDGYVGAWYPSGEPEPERFGAYVIAAQDAESSARGAHGSCDGLGR